jgi:hypothetical protein
MKEGLLGDTLRVFTEERARGGRLHVARWIGDETRRRRMGQRECRDGGKGVVRGQSAAFRRSRSPVRPTQRPLWRNPGSPAARALGSCIHSGAGISGHTPRTRIARKAGRPARRLRGTRCIGRRRRSGRWAARLLSRDLESTGEGPASPGWLPRWWDLSSPALASPSRRRSTHDGPEFRESRCGVGMVGMLAPMWMQERRVSAGRVSEVL